VEKYPQNIWAATEDARNAELYVVYEDGGSDIERSGCPLAFFGLLQPPRQKLG